MFDYDVKKVKKTSRTSKTDYFKNPNKQKKKKNKKKKKSNSFWDVPHQYTTEDESNLNYNYFELEKKLAVESAKWGVDSISSQILDLIKEDYNKYQETYHKYQDNTLIKSFSPLAKKSLKKGYDQAKKVLPTLNRDIDKLIIATYSKSIDKLKNWSENKEPSEQQFLNKVKTKDYNTEKLIKKIANLFIEQGIYLEEKKVHHPIINTKR